MNLRTFLNSIAATAALAVTVPATADTLYVATSNNSGAGGLYSVNPADATFTLIGSLVDAAGFTYSLTGLAVDQNTGTLYGGTANVGTTRSMLVTIDPLTAVVTPVGSYGNVATMSDITVDPVSGVMYGWQSAAGHQLHTINAATGAATVVGSILIGDFGGGGLAMSSGQVLYSTPDGFTSPTPTLRTVSTADGSTTIVANLLNGPVGLVVNALDFDSAGTLFGVNSTATPGGARHLVTINTATANMTDIGRLPDGSDALAFVRLSAGGHDIPEADTVAAGFVCGLGVVTLVWRRRRA